MNEGMNMLGSEALDIAIGLVFVYTLLSLLAGAVNEIILNVLPSRTLRAYFLEKEFV
jgi:hypothetical protein